MKAIQPVAIYVLWQRDLRRLVRAKSRLIGTLMMPVFFLIFLGSGFRGSSVPGMPPRIDYVLYLVPGILGMNLLFSSTFTGLSVLWDREFGFLKEIMVAPVSRVSIVLGRIAGGVTTSLIQALMVLGFSMMLGFNIRSLPSFLLAFLFMVLISSTFIGLGLIFASNMRDMQGFNMIMTFVIFPLFFLSGSLFPLDNFPHLVRLLSFVDPLTYGVDGLRGALLGVGARPISTNLALLGLAALLMVLLGAYFFEKSESV